jgi:ABC-type sugar transport system permease subunit
LRRTPKPVNRIATPGRAETAPLPVKVMDEGTASAIGWDYVRSRPLKRLLRKLEPYCWVAPACGVLFVFTHLPILLEGGLSLLAADGFSAPRFIGLNNYLEVLSNRDFWEAIGHNVIYTVATVTGKVVLSLSLAVLLNRQLFGRDIFRTILFLPVVLSFVAIGVLWTLFLNFDYGVLNAVLNALGLKSLRQDWLGSAETALGAVIFVDIWKWTGFHLVIYLAGLQSIPRDLYEAALLDGANVFQRFWRITVPLLRPFTAINVLLASLGGFSVFDLIYVMTQGGPFKATNVAMVEVYLQAFQFNRLGYAGAMSVVLLGLVATMSVLIIRITKTKTS